MAQCWPTRPEKKIPGDLKERYAFLRKTKKCPSSSLDVIHQFLVIPGLLQIGVTVRLNIADTLTIVEWKDGKKAHRL